jgi:hypothetical protein
VGALTNRGDFKLATDPPVALGAQVPAPKDVRAYVERYAGAHPAARDAVDKRILDGVTNGTSHIIDAPSHGGDPKQTSLVRSTAEVPAQPFAASSLPGMLRIEAWLCEKHIEAGGPSTPECSLPVKSYKAALRSGS